MLIPPTPSLRSTLSLIIPFFSTLTSALITYQSIRTLTSTTTDSLSRISNLHIDFTQPIDNSNRFNFQPTNLRDDLIEVLRDGRDMDGVLLAGKVEELIFGDSRGGEGGHEEDEVEITVSAALQILGSAILVELEKPLSSEIDTIPSCATIKKEYHAHLSSTVKLLQQLKDLQFRYQWKADESGVFDSIGWLQGLWASRSSNSQNRSFIEQRLSLYSTTSCFAKNEVLRRDVEVVEFLNDLLDSFD